MMLNTLKEKLLSSVKNQEELTTSALSPNKINAGSEILKHFQEQWSDLHALNENNATNLRIAAATTKHIHDHMEAQKNNFSQLNEWILSLPYLCNTLNHCANCLSDVYTSCDLVERKLYVLENLIEEIEFHCGDKEQKLLEKMSENLVVEDHQYDQSELENKTPEEKQKIFEKAFQSDLEKYKKLGTTTREIKKCEAEAVLLEEIQIECNTNELEDFLDDS